MKKSFQQKNKAFTLLETLVALSIFSLSIVGLMVVLGSGIADTIYAKQKITAGYLAQQGIECVRNIRDTSVLYDERGAERGWDAFKRRVRDTGQDEDVPGLGICPINPDPAFSSFTRVLSADTRSFGQDEIRVFSTVSWTQGSIDHSITFSENLFNWVE